MDYANGQIYAIRSNLTDKIYIGSTAQPLHKRFYQHKMHKAHDCTSREIIKHADAYIELIENFPCQSKKELNRREGQHIRNTENCVNKNVAGRTPQETCAQYYAAHKAEILENRREYHIEHRDEILEYKKEHYAAHRAEILEKRKEYQLTHRTKILERRKQLYAAKKLASQSAPSSEA